MPFSDLKPLTAKCLHQVWQKEWDESIIVSNKLHGILPKLSDKLLTFCNTRKEDTVLNRLHIGHSYFTHSFLLKKEEASVYVACNTTITVKHSLIECADLVEVRKKYFEENLCIHCSEMWIRRAFLTTWKILVCFIKYKVFQSKFYVEKYFNWNILTVIQKTCGFSRNMCDFVYVCMFEIIVL